MEPIMRSYKELGEYIQCYIDAERNLHRRLERLTGCSNFGSCDGMNGSCHYCKENNIKLFKNCWEFTFNKEYKE